MSAPRGAEALPMDTPDQPEPDLRPWVWPYAVRRDCEPHRGVLLARLGLGALMLALFCMAMGIPCAAILSDELLLPGLPSPERAVVFLMLITPGFLGSLGVWWLATRDLREMSEGLRDPAGEESTTQARSCGRAGVVLTVLATAFWTLCIVTLLAVRDGR